MALLQLPSLCDCQHAGILYCDCCGRTLCYRCYKHWGGGHYTDLCSGCYDRVRVKKNVRQEEDFAGMRQ